MQQKCQRPGECQPLWPKLSSVLSFPLPWCWRLVGGCLQLYAALGVQPATVCENALLTAHVNIRNPTEPVSFCKHMMVKYVCPLLVRLKSLQLHSIADDVLRGM